MVEGHAISVLQLERPYPSHRVGIKIEGGRDKEGCATVVEDQGVTSDEGAVRNAPDVHAFVSQRYSFQDLKMSVQKGYSAFFIGKNKPIRTLKKNLAIRYSICKELCIDNWHGYRYGDTHDWLS